MNIYKLLTRYGYVYSWNGVIGILVITLGAILLSLFLYKGGKIRKSQAVAIVLFAAYIALVFVLTVFGRKTGRRKYELRLFWSYAEIYFGNTKMISEVILNIFMLTPLGVLLPIIRNKKVFLYKGLIMGFVISLTIELLQLATCTGLFELDDILHNSLGCMLGCMIGVKLQSLLNISRV